jgi:hypothetical protein
MKTKQTSRIHESPAKIRHKKVVAVRRQLRQEKYDIDSRLPAILDRVLEDLAR